MQQCLAECSKQNREQCKTTCRLGQFCIMSLSGNLSGRRKAFSLLLEITIRILPSKTGLPQNLLETHNSLKPKTKKKQKLPNSFSLTWLKHALPLFVRSFINWPSSSYCPLDPNRIQRCDLMFTEVSTCHSCFNSFMDFLEGTVLAACKSF